MSIVWTSYLRSALPPATSEDREQIEIHIRHVLPDAYWNMARFHQGCIPSPDRVSLADGLRARLGVFLFLVDRSRVERLGERSYGLLSAFESVKDFYPAGVVPFSDDTGGNFMAFDYRSGPSPKIVFVDHEVEGEQGLIPAASDFLSLMNSRQA